MAHSVMVDYVRRHILVELDGYFSLDEFRRMEVDVRREIKRLAGRPFTCLVDASKHGVQSQVVTEAAQQLITDIATTSAKLAIVSQGALAKMQAQRLVGGERQAVFGTVTEADAWLSE